MKYKVHTFLSSELPLNYEHFGCVETLSLVLGKGIIRTYIIFIQTHYQ